MPIPPVGRGSLSMPAGPMGVVGRALDRPGVEGWEMAVEPAERSHRMLEEAPRESSGQPWCCVVAVERQ